MGGSAGGAGTRFEDLVGAFYLCGLLAGSSSAGQKGLPSGVYVTRLLRQAFLPVDDIVLVTSSGGGIYLQNKRRLFATETNPDFKETLSQFKQLALNIIDEPLGPWNRAIDSQVDRLGIVVPHTAAQNLDVRIDRLANTAREASDWESFEHVVSQTEELQEALATVVSVLDSVEPDVVLTEQQKLTLLQCLALFRFDLGSSASSDFQHAIHLLTDHVVLNANQAIQVWTYLVNLSSQLGMVQNPRELD